MSYIWYTYTEKDKYICNKHTEPWRTPLVTGSHLDLTPLNERFVVTRSIFQITAMRNDVLLKIFPKHLLVSPARHQHR